MAGFERERMVANQIAARGVENPLVLAAMRTVPRHEFVPKSQRRHAYEDRPLSLGWRQTISQPFMVAVMTERCGLAGGEKVLEIGTGSGYQAAILAEIAERVYTVEIIEPLVRRAAARLARLHYENVICRFGDGGFGWEELAPFDAIVVSAAAPESVPQILLDQLAEGGRLVAPVGRHDQHLEILVRRGKRFERRRGASVRFVPLVGGAVP